MPRTWDSSTPFLCVSTWITGPGERGCGPLSAPNSVCLCSYLCVASIKEWRLLNSVVHTEWSTDCTTHTEEGCNEVRSVRRRELQADYGQQMSRREERGRGCKTWWSREYMYIWEVLGRRRGNGRSLRGGEGVGGPWEEGREWEVLGRRRGSGRSLGGGEGVGGP